LEEKENKGEDGGNLALEDSDNPKTKIFLTESNN